jgi:hypothetical protein
MKQMRPVRLACRGIRPRRGGDRVLAVPCPTHLRRRQMHRRMACQQAPPAPRLVPLGPPTVCPGRPDTTRPAMAMPGRRCWVSAPGGPTGRLPPASLPPRQSSMRPLICPEAMADQSGRPGRGSPRSRSALGVSHTLSSSAMIGPALAERRISDFPSAHAGSELSTRRSRSTRLSAVW